MTIPILYEDDFLVVLDKPTGLSVVAEKGRETTTVADWVKDRYKYNDHSIDKEDEFEYRFGIVHRLDKDTSGVLLIARTKEVFSYLKGLFKFRRMTKTYQALVYGSPPDERFEICVPLTRNRRQPTLYAVGAEGREAITEFAVIKRLSSATYLHAYPKTGRTHQIRVHLRALGHPVVNDTKYASKALLESSKGQYQGRMMLHAKSVSFIDWEGQERQFSSPTDLTDYF